MSTTISRPRSAPPGIDDEAAMAPIDCAHVQCGPKNGRLWVERRVPSKIAQEPFDSSSATFDQHWCNVVDGNLILPSYLNTMPTLPRVRRPDLALGTEQNRWRAPDLIPVVGESSGEQPIRERAHQFSGCPRGRLRQAIGLAEDLRLAFGRRRVAGPILSPTIS